MKPSMFGVCFCVVGLVGPASAAGEDKPTPLCSIPVWKDEPGHPHDFQWMDFDSTGRHLAVRVSLPMKDDRQDANLEIYEVANGKRVTGTTLASGGWNTHGRYPLCAISPKGDWVANLKNSELQFLTIPPHKPTLPVKVNISGPFGFGSVGNTLWPDTDGKGLFVQYAAEDEYSLRYSLCWWDLSKANAGGVATKREVFRTEIKEMQINTVALKATAGLFAAALRADGVADGKKPLLQTWSLGEKSVKTEITLPRYASALAIAPEGKRVAVGFPDGSVAWYDLATKKSIKHIALPVAFTVGSLSIHPGGGYIACGTFDNGRPNLFLLDLASGEIVAKLLPDVKGVVGVCFSPNGDKLAAFGSSGTITIWDATKLLKLERD